MSRQRQAIMREIAIKESTKNLDQMDSHASDQVQLVQYAQSVVIDPPEENISETIDNDSKIEEPVVSKKKTFGKKKKIT